MAEESDKPRRAPLKEKTPVKSGVKAQTSGTSRSGPHSGTQGVSRPSGGAPRSDRPQSGSYRPRDGQPSGQRSGGSSGQGYRPQGDRPQGGFRPRDGQPQGGSYRPRDGQPSGQRSGGSPGQGYRPQGDRPQGGFRPRDGQPQGQRPRSGSPGARPQGDRPQGGYGHGPSQGARPAYRDAKASDDDDSVRGLGKDTGADDTDSAPAGVKMAVRLPKKSDDYSRSYRGTSARATSGQHNSPNRQGGHAKGKTAPGGRSKQYSVRQPMLSMHKVMPFKYDMNQILMTTSMDPSKASGFLATVVAKASRVSVKEAKVYVASFLEAGDITKDEHDKFCRLLERYSKYR